MANNNYDGWTPSIRTNTDRQATIIEQLRAMCDSVEWDQIKDKMPTELYDIWLAKKTAAQESDKRGQVRIHRGRGTDRLPERR